MYILAVDPGILSVGLFGAVMNVAGELCSVDICQNVDMRAPFAAPANIHAYISEFLRLYAEHFARADVLLVEKQPVGSAGMPLELILRERFGRKCVFVHPATLHKHYGSAGYEYDARKAMGVRMVRAALGMWAGVPGAATALARIDSLERQHDCADACLFFIYYATVMYQKPKAVPTALEEAGSMSDAIERFRWNGALASGVAGHAATKCAETFGVRGAAAARGGHDAGQRSGSSAGGSAAYGSQGWIDVDAANLHGAAAATTAGNSSQASASSRLDSARDGAHAHTSGSLGDARQGHSGTASH
jgi:hypothetical protein